MKTSFPGFTLSPLSTQFTRSIILGLCLIYVPVCNAEDTIGLGVTVNGSAWEGDNGSANGSFESDDGGQFALSFNYRHDNFYTGINLQGGEYDFDSTAPSQFTSLGVVNSSGIKVEHQELDLLVGYYFWTNVSLFLDLKVTRSEWRDTGYEQVFSGLGLGVSGFHSINQDWLLFGSLGFVNGDLDDNDDSSLGEGTSTALVGGAVYRIDNNNTINFGIKLRSYDFDYDEGNQQEYSLNGLFFGYHHIFHL